MDGICGDRLMEDDWKEGFDCSLPTGHDGPHRDEDATGINASSTSDGRLYRWVYEWGYIDG